MNRVLWGVKLSQWSVVVFFAVMTGQSAADGVAVVPGKTNGYFYDVSSNQTDSGKEVSLVVKKEGHFKEYTIESADGALRCDQQCPETSQRLPAGSVTLKIIGKKPVSFLDIPLTGKWSEPCNNTQTETAQCVFNLNELNGAVSVEVSPDIEVGTTMELPGGGEGLIVRVNVRDGYVLMAAHENLGSDKTWLLFRPDQTKDLKINSPVDGLINTQKLLELKVGAQAAAYCKAIGTDWYLPANAELSLMTPDSLRKIPGLDEEDSLWSSTESGVKTGNRNQSKKPYLAYQAKALYVKDNRMYNEYVYLYDQEPDGSWTEDKSYTKKYKVLCFGRLIF